MGKNNKKDSQDWKERLMVFSTNPENTGNEDNEENLEETPLPEKQKLYVSLDKKQRGGKKVTLVEGFVGHEDDLAELAKELKKLCGVGGGVKDEEILIQGDFREKIFDYLVKNKYQVKKKGG
jgi:translation initiation factor 1